MRGLPEIFLLLMMAGLAAIYVVRFRHLSADIYVPAAAWLRAGIYFLACLLVAKLTGALAATVANPLATAAQMRDPLWLASTLGVTVFIVWAYWIYWAGHTIHFDRPFNFLPQLVFGLSWGITSGLLFLSFWHVALLIGASWDRWQVWLLAYTMISLWQMFWMDMVWDVYVAPEHDSPWSIKRKVPRTHIPNMTLCLTYFAVYENYWIFIGWQTLALLAASFGMRMPAPWSKVVTPPARRVAGLLGLPRAGGYLSRDPANDRHLKAANLPE